jgi:hypothetical protein
MGVGAAIIGGIGAAVQVVGAVKSFSDAKKQKDLKDEADREAAQAMIEMENLLQTNYAESVQVPLEPYELAMQGNAAVQSQNIQALRESGDRALIGGVGKAMAAGADANEAQRLQMQRDLMNRDMRVAAENDRIRNQQVGVELGTVQGAQKAAAQAEVRAMQLNAQGFQGLAGAASTGLDAMGLYEGFGGGQGGGANTSMAPNTPIYNQPNTMNTWYPDGIVPPTTVTNDQINQGNQVVGGVGGGADYWSDFNIDGE